MRVLPRSTPVRGATALGISNAASALMILARNVLIANLISVENFGIASTFALAATLVEAGTNIALDRLVVQDVRGGRRSFVSALHVVQVLRGIVGGVVLLAFGQGIASMMGVPQYGWAYQMLAIVPLIRGFTHLDVFRAQRRMRFVPHAAAQVIANAVALAAAWPLAAWLGDFRVMLAAVLIQQVALVAMSHAFVRSRYRLRWDAAVLRHSLRFGAPLMLNGVAMFLALQGDLFLVGTFLGMEVLGWFAVAFSLTLLPANILANTAQSLMLPGLSGTRHNAEWNARVGMTLGGTVLLALVMVLAFITLGPVLIDLLFGARYASATEILPYLAVLQGIRLAKAGPAIISIARGETHDPLLANLARLLAIPCAFIWLAMGGGVFSVIAFAIIGECGALLCAYLLLIRRGVIAVPRIAGRVRHG